MPCALEQISSCLTRYMGPLVIVSSVVALIYPPSLLWSVSYISAFLGIIMFGMGMSLKWQDFAAVFTHPRLLCIGVAAQFTIMPLLAFFLSLVFALPAEIAIGVILVGTAPGGTSSNVIAYIARGNVPLSVAMTATSTLAALVFMPLLTKLLGGVWLPVDGWALFLSVFKIIFIPVTLGILANKFFGTLTAKAMTFMPGVSSLGIIVIVGGIVAANASRLLTVPATVFIVVVLHNALGLLLGYMLCRFVRCTEADRRAICFEVGTQNAGLAAALAMTHFSPIAALAPAVCSAWQVFSGALVANWFRNRPVDK